MLKNEASPKTKAQVSVPYAMYSSEFGYNIDKSECSLVESLQIDS